MFTHFLCITYKVVAKNDDFVCETLDDSKYILFAISLLIIIIIVLLLRWLS